MTPALKSMMMLQIHLKSELDKKGGNSTTSCCVDCLATIGPPHHLRNQGRSETDPSLEGTSLRHLPSALGTSDRPLSLSSPRAVCARGLSSLFSA